MEIRLLRNQNTSKSVYVQNPPYEALAIFFPHRPQNLILNMSFADNLPFSLS
jgi:hypothetical protein